MDDVALEGKNNNNNGMDKIYNINHLLRVYMFGIASSAVCVLFYFYDYELSNNIICILQMMILKHWEKS